MLGNKFLKILADLVLVALFPILLYSSHLYLSILIWVAFVPLIILALKNSFADFWIYIFVSAALVSVIIAYPLKNFSLELSIIAMLYIACVYIISFIICWFLYKKIKYPYAVLIFPILWFLVNIICSFGPAGANIWFEFAYLQPMLSPLIGIVGIMGITFLIMAVNSAIAFYIVYKDKKILRFLILIFIVLSSCFAYSYTAVPTGRKVRVALIQGNFHNDWAWRMANAENKIINTYEKMSLEAAKNKPDIIIWPEYAIPADIMNNKNLYDRIANIARQTNAVLVFGSVGLTEQTDPQYNYTKNVANVFSENGSFIGKYESILPSPYNGNVIPGTDLTVFDTVAGKFGISVCSEEYYNFIHRSYVKSGADFFVVLANDEPLKDLNMIKVKAMHSRLLAAENNRYLLRVENTAFTEVINPYGKIVASLEPNKEGILIADIFIK